VLAKAWGRRGELSAVSLSGGPERFESAGEVFLFGAEDRPEPHEIEWVWEHRGRLIFKFRGIDTITDAERLEGAEVRVPISARTPLEEGEFYESDLVGCEVIERGTGVRLGTVRSFEEYGGPGLLEVEGRDGPILIPFARSICVEIDPARRRIVVDLPEGLKELSGR
jgi:16S rRNA processing protein RimM